MKLFKKGIALCVAMIALIGAVKTLNALPDPLTGVEEPTRTCIEGDANNCKTYKVFVEKDKDGNPWNAWVRERACKASAGGECAISLSKGDKIAMCKAIDNATCRVRIAIDQ